MPGLYKDLNAYERQMVDFIELLMNLSYRLKLPNFFDFPDFLKATIVSLRI